MMERRALATIARFVSDSARILPHCCQGSILENTHRGPHELVYHDCGKTLRYFRNNDNNLVIPRVSDSNAPPQVTTRAVVHALLCDRKETQEKAAALMYNLALKEAS